MLQKKEGDLHSRGPLFIAGIGYSTIIPIALPVLGMGMLRPVTVMSTFPVFAHLRTNIAYTNMYQPFLYIPMHAYLCLRA